MLFLKPIVKGIVKTVGNSTLNIYIFHRVLEKKDPLRVGEPDLKQFDKILRLIKSMHEVLPLSEGVKLLQKDALPFSSASITFDDGYLDNFTNAAPLLKKHGVPGTIFVASNVLGDIMWNDDIIETVRLSETMTIPSLNVINAETRTVPQKHTLLHKIIPQIKYLSPLMRGEIISEIRESAQVKYSRQLMMRREHVSKLKCFGIDVGGHTCSHPILSKLSDKDAKDEIVNCKKDLQELTGNSVNYFAYPNGKLGIDFEKKHVMMVKEAGYIGAVSTEQGQAKHGDSVFELPRFTPWRSSNIGWASQILASNFKSR